jgi:uncharacterized protein YbaR (Trm112 family)
LEGGSIIDFVKKELMDILACPVCKGELELNVGEKNEKEIVTGSLYCHRCDERYPIIDSIPNLLPPNQHD